MHHQSTGQWDGCDPKDPTQQFAGEAKLSSRTRSSAYYFQAALRSGKPSRLPLASPSSKRSSWYKVGWHDSPKSA